MLILRKHLSLMDKEYEIPKSGMANLWPVGFQRSELGLRILLNTVHQPLPTIWSLLKIEIHFVIAGLTPHPLL